MASRPRYPAYQIDFQMISTGKLVSGTKRRIRWRFGFPNREALDAGLKGNDCRGEEHDITIVWSVASGKRMVLADGHQVHVSVKRSDVFEYSWTLRGNHVCKIVAFAAPPMSAAAGFRQYDLLIDGMSYFTMPKVYQLGIKGSSPQRTNQYENGASHGGASGGGMQYDLRTGQYVGAPRTPQEEEEALQAAIQASLAESKQYVEQRAASATGVGEGAESFTSGGGTASMTAPAPEPAPKEEVADLLDLFSEPAPSPAPGPGAMVPAPSSAAHQFGSFAAPTPAPVAAPAPSVNIFDPNTAGYDVFGGPSNALVPSGPQGGQSAGYGNYSLNTGQGQTQPTQQQMQQQQQPGPSQGVFDRQGSFRQQQPPGPGQGGFDRQASFRQSMLGNPSAPPPAAAPPRGSMVSQSSFRAGSSFTGGAPLPQQQPQRQPSVGQFFGGGSATGPSSSNPVAAPAPFGSGGGDIFGLASPLSAGSSSSQGPGQGFGGQQLQQQQASQQQRQYQTPQQYPTMGQPQQQQYAQGQQFASQSQQHAMPFGGGYQQGQPQQSMQGQQQQQQQPFFQQQPQQQQFPF